VELELPVLPELPELPELELELEPDEPEVLLVPEPEFPEADVLGVLEEVELVEPEPDVVDVVAALATNAPPATRPEASAPLAMTLRNRICMNVALSGLVVHPLTRASASMVRPRPVGERTST
jgi:hypothetical protein